MRIMLMIAGALLIATAVALETRSWAGAANVAVDISDDFYEDASGDSSTTISVGDTVTWTWMGSNPHTVTADDSSFDSANPTQTSGTFAHTFNSVGSFDYFCQVHGTAMTGTINVQAAPTATNTATAPTATRTSDASRTPTRTATGTVTPQASATPAAAATLPVDPTAEAAAPISAPAPEGGAGAGVGAPQTGYGSAKDARDLHGLSAALGIIGVMLAVGAVVVRRRS